MLDWPLMATRNVASALSGAVTARTALGRTRAACEDWPRLHPFEGRQNMSKKLDKRAIRDLLDLGWSEDKILRVFLQIRERQIRALIERQG